MEKGRIDIVTMGCSKNLVDSERLLHALAAKGYAMHHDSPDVRGEVVVVNTCGFIADAKQESIDMILRLAEGKKTGQIGSLMVMGCLSERYMADLKEALPEVDRWYGKFSWRELIDTLPDLTACPAECKPWERDLTTPPYSAYLKISEGCNRMCAYCAIPLITGRHTSRPVAEVLAEVGELAAKGVSEFNVIAQDLSAYGTDIGFPKDGRSGLAALVDAMADIPGVRWIRLHYAYPVDFPWDVLEVMRRRPNVCNYLDIALQHISTPVLENMRRHIDKEQTLSVIERIRREVPGIRLRTTLMTGFPGEGEAEFEELKEFVSTARFDRMGAFAYQEEDDTYAQRHFEDSVPEHVKEARKAEILDIQEDISLELNQALIGSEVEVLIERHDADEYMGRTQWDSPEVDCEVHIPVEASHGELEPGEYVTVRITGADPFDLYAERVR